MTWFKVDDGFYDHPKFLDVPNSAIGLWVKAGAWCGKHLTDGVIPASQVRLFRGTASQINALISARIWVESCTENGAKAYRFHDWNEYQPTREAKLKEREDSAERQRKSRERKRQEQGQRENVTRDSHVTGSRDSHESHSNVSQRPDPTRPDPDSKESLNNPPLSPPLGDIPPGGNNEKTGTKPTKKKTTTNGTRLPNDWNPPADAWQKMANENPGLDLNRETDKFRDYWHAKTGKDATKRDWTATWRNWIRTAAERQQPRWGTPQPARRTGTHPSDWLPPEYHPPTTHQQPLTIIDEQPDF